MTVRITAELRGSLPGSILGLRDVLAQDVTIGLRGVAQGGVAELRQELARAFPGSRRIPTMITGKATPEGNAYSLDAAARFYGRGGKTSAWPAPLWAQAFGATIAARGGALAVPTARVPRDGRNRALSPREVELRFGERLQPVPPGRFGKLGALILRGVTVGRSGRVRRATAGRARQGRAAQPVVMFWLVRQVTLQSRWDPRAVIARWADLAPELVARAAAARAETERGALIERGAMMSRGEFQR